MKSLTYMISEEAKRNKATHKGKLFNIFNRSFLKSACSSVLSSIVAFSILGIADKSFAVIVGLKKDGNRHELYYTPEVNNNRVDANLEERPNLDVLFCRPDGWCYVDGISSGQKTRYIGNSIEYYLETSGRIAVKAWIESKSICDQFGIVPDTIIDIISNCDNRPDALVYNTSLQQANVVEGLHDALVKLQEVELYTFVDNPQQRGFISVKILQRFRDWSLIPPELLRKKNDTASSKQESNAPRNPTTE